MNRNQQNQEYEGQINSQQQYQYQGGIYNPKVNGIQDLQQQQQQLDMSNLLQQDGYQNVNSMSVVERTKLWAEYKDKKISEAKQKKDKDDKAAQDCTFKPQINNDYNTKRKTNRSSLADEASNQQVSNKGLDKYLHRMNQARERKEEQQVLEDKLFKKGQNWKPKLTTPIEPNLTSFKKNQGDSKDQLSNIKALHKPVNPLQQQSLQQQQFQSDLSKMLRGSRSNEDPQQNQDESQSSFERNAFSPLQIKNTKDFVRLAQRNKDQFVELRSDMQYEEAINLIHQHILNLEI